MAKLTIENIYKGHGNILNIRYKCSFCKMILDLPQQQRIANCFHCGIPIDNFDSLFCHTQRLTIKLSEMEPFRTYLI